MKNLVFSFLSFLVFACNGQNRKTLITDQNDKINQQMTAKIVFGGGCFWCLQPGLERLKGVEKVVSGYSGGHKDHPTYQEVCTGEAGHAEVVEIIYHPAEINYQQLMEVFFFLHDPTQLNRQGNDIGTQYRSVIFYQNEAEKKLAEEAIQKSEATGKWKGKYVTEVVKLEKFWPAEAYHQDYYLQNPNQPYCSAVVGPKYHKFIKHFEELGWLKNK